jgi:hypothetical protein
MSIQLPTSSTSALHPRSSNLVARSFRLSADFNLTGLSASPSRIIPRQVADFWCPGFTADASASSNALDAPVALTQTSSFAGSTADNTCDLRTTTGGHTFAEASSERSDGEGDNEESDDGPEEDRDVDSERHNHGDRGQDFEDDIPAFPRFAKLPAEIQMMIWGHTLPHPRDVPDAILVFVNFDLNRPRATLPSLAAIAGLYEEVEDRNQSMREDSEYFDVLTQWDLTLKKKV